MIRSSSPSRGGPGQQVQRPVRSVAPAERLVVDDERAGVQHRPVVAAVGDLVDVAQADVPRVDAEVGQQAKLLQPAGPGLAMGEERCARPPMRRGCRLEHAPVARGRAAVAAGHLDHAGADRRAPDDRSRVVVLVDPLDDVGHEPVGQLVHGDRHAPVIGRVPALVVEPGRRHDPDPATLGQLGQLAGVPARPAGHRVHGAAQPERRGVADLVGHRQHVRQVEVGLELDRPPAVDDEVLVGVRDPEVARDDVAEHGPDECHRSGSGPASGSAAGGAVSGSAGAVCGSAGAAVTDQPPSTARTWPVTARASSDSR